MKLKQVKYICKECKKIGDSRVCKVKQNFNYSAPRTCVYSDNDNYTAKWILQ